MERFLSIVLVLHITGGSLALLSGLLAMLTPKGGRWHRLGGKCYFGGMTAVFISAIILSIAHHIPFLLMVGFFSYYMVVRGYRILYLKRLGNGQRATGLDWMIVVVAGVFIIGLLAWGVIREIAGDHFGRVGILFGTVGLLFLVSDLKSFLRGPSEKMHWWYSHIGGMGGGYIAALTAFIVVNFQMSPGWVLWVLPTLIGAPVIRLTIRKYRKLFASREATTESASGAS